MSDRKASFKPSVTRIICHIRTSNGARFSVHADEDELRDELVEYWNEVHAQGEYEELADDCELQNAIDQVEEREDVSWEETVIYLDESEVFSCLSNQ